MVAGEQTKTVRRGPPHVGNGSGGRLDAEERAHSRVSKAAPERVLLWIWGRGELAKEIGWTS